MNQIIEIAISTNTTNNTMDGQSARSSLTQLSSSIGCDLTAHRILLDLATTPEGAVQLVTTNFDRLFDDCGRELPTWQPPRLPDPLHENEINGVVYLHGRSTPTYTGAEGDGFVLSSSEFGRAYLSDGWATTFIREILNKYVVVFVGYTADDPPVQYLLEALRKASGIHGPIRKMLLEIHREAEGDGSFICVDAEQVIVIAQQL